MSAVLGVEGGGSHTHAILVGGSGEFLGAAASRDCSNWEDVGIEAAGAAIKSCVRSALASAGARPEEVIASTFALAGVDFPIDQKRLSGVPEALGVGGPAWIVNDSFAALRAGTDQPFGVVVAAGTGSIVAGRNPGGETFRTLGLGPTFGDYGSASEVSEAAVSSVADAHLGRGPQTELTGQLCEASGAPSVDDFLEGAGRGRIDTSVFAQIVVRAAERGDPVARAILRRAGERLGETAAFVVRKLGMVDMRFDLVLAGGLLRSGSRDLTDALRSTVHGAAPGASPIFLEDPAVVGSAILAMEEVGRPPGPGVRAEIARAAASALGLPPR
jgi:N-acetylglucosamine kinase-like BadF-type ATPase